jgi:hypothetical protein
MRVAQGLNYSYFEGSWDELPDFGKMEASDEGTVDNFDLSSAREKNYFGFRFGGFIKIAKRGVYTFYTGSDDGSQLFIGTIALDKGLHPISVTFFEKTGASDLKVSYRGPGIEKQPIPPQLLFRRK